MPQASSKATDVSIGVCYYPEHGPEAVWAEDARRMCPSGSPPNSSASRAPFSPVRVAAAARPRIAFRTISRRGRTHYIAGAPDEALLQRIVARLAGAAGLETLDLPAGLRTRTRGSHRFIFNYGPQPAGILPHFPATRFELGGARLEVGDVAVLREAG
ncbi:MAG: hypothetical protein H5U13_07025 [Parvibaculum sp.]|nr:hypothetical protein [Parvibaculum sp.]